MRMQVPKPESVTDDVGKAKQPSPPPVVEPTFYPEPPVQMRVDEKPTNEAEASRPGSNRRPDSNDQNQFELDFGD